MDTDIDQSMASEEAAESRSSYLAPSASPGNGAAAAPVNNLSAPLPLSPRLRPPVQSRPRTPSFHSMSPISLGSPGTRPRSGTHSRDGGISPMMMSSSPPTASSPGGTPKGRSSKKCLSDESIVLAKAKSKSARKMNDSMVYLDGPQVYTCAQCRTHLTSHDDIISKSFHGRRGRAYLFDQCVNVVIGPAEDRLLITGLHSVCDIFCKRCKGMVGWTYAKAYEQSQKYKEGKFIIEKINLHLEESDYYKVHHPAGERSDRWRLRSMSWGSEGSAHSSSRTDIIYEYRAASPSMGSSSSAAGAPPSPRYWESPAGQSNGGNWTSSPLRPRYGGSHGSGSPPAAPDL